MLAPQALFLIAVKCQLLRIFQIFAAPIDPAASFACLVGLYIFRSKQSSRRPHPIGNSQDMQPQSTKMWHNLHRNQNHWKKLQKRKSASGNLRKNDRKARKNEKQSLQIIFGTRLKSPLFANPLALAHLPQL
ncbi:malate dehydrogenase [Roseobacter sp. SK209-2-6]|nr:malate dehydrogenase [Roseobacter sp. SK209-2-6]